MEGNMAWRDGDNMTKQQALEIVLEAARQFAQIIADDEGKTAEDEEAENAIWDAIEELGGTQVP
jgi:hypothetical protein